MKEKSLLKAKWLLPGLTVLFVCLLAAAYCRDGADRVEEGPALLRETAVRAVDVNTADAETLESLPGIGPALARRIVEYRTVYGPFQRKEELTKVSGIGWELLAALEDHITTDGGGNE